MPDVKVVDLGDATSTNTAQYPFDRVTTPDGDADVARGKTGFGADGEYFDVCDATPLPVMPKTARNTRGAISALAVGLTATVAALVADAAFRFRGFTGTGTADGQWTVKYGATPVYDDWTNIVRPVARLMLPNGDVPGASVTVTIAVTNNGTGPADFAATILGE